MDSKDLKNSLLAKKKQIKKLHTCPKPFSVGVVAKVYTNPFIFENRKKILAFAERIGYFFSMSPSKA